MARLGSSHLFFSVPGAQQEYEELRLDPDPESQSIRELIEQMWSEYRLYADSNFLQQARNNDFQARYWELYLGCSLLRQGIQIEPRATHRQRRDRHNLGPDFKIIAPCHTWIEAVAPGAGTTADAVPRAEPCQASSVPDDEMKLRFLDSIRQKAKDRLCYIVEGLVDPRACYVIAINTGKIPRVPDLDPPRIVRAVFGLGLPEASLDLAPSVIVDSRFQLQNQILRRRTQGPVSAQRPVFTRIFLDPEPSEDPSFDYVGYEGISAVLSSSMTPFNSCEPGFDYSRFVLGDDYCLIHNRLAVNPLPQGFLKVGREYWLNDTGNLRSKVWFADRAQSSEAT